MKKNIRWAIHLCLALLILTPISPQQHAQAAGFPAWNFSSLQDAINAANINGEADTITLSQDITLSNTLPQITSDITIVGTGFTLNGDGSWQILNVGPNGVLTLTNITITNGHSTNGGGIYSEGTLNINNSTIYGNAATSDGGGVYADGRLVVNGSSFEDNSATRGAGIYFVGGTANIDESNFSTNTTEGNGSGIFIDAGTTSVTNSSFYTNTATVGAGAGIYKNSGQLNIDNGTFSGNTAAFHGGGIYNYTGQTEITASAFLANEATQNGGALNNEDGNLTLNGCTISTNSARDGGGIASAGTTTIDNCSIFANHATGSSSPSFPGHGGAIFSTSILEIENSTFSANTAQNVGGAIHSAASSSLIIINSTFYSNTAMSIGGIDNDGTFTALYNTIIANSTGGDCSSALPIDFSHNLIKDSSNACNIPNGVYGSIIGEDPVLGELADNGGNTLTHALLTNSPAIDNGNSGTICPTEDQRGITRPQDGDGDSTATCDIGAYEKLASYDLNVAKTGSGSLNGSVTSTPAGIDCGATCTANFEVNTVVTLTAATIAGITFDGWSGACSGAGDCIVTLDATQEVTATFTQEMRALEVNLSGTGSGSVTSNPPGIDCGSTCNADFAIGTIVTLTAATASGSTFDGWSGACSGTSDCIVTLDATQEVTATFTQDTNMFELEIDLAGSGSGTVTSNPPGIDCGTTCNANFASGTNVILTANADSGSEFTGWSGGGCNGTGNCTVTMNTAQTVVATFESESEEDKTIYLPLVIHNWPPKVELEDAPDLCGEAYPITLNIGTYQDDFDAKAEGTDADWYRFDATQGTSYMANVSELGNTQNTVVNLLLYDSACQNVGLESTSLENNTRLEWTHEWESGRYHLLVYEVYGHTGTDTSYELTVKTSSP